MEGLVMDPQMLPMTSFDKRPPLISGGINDQSTQQDLKNKENMTQK